MQEYTLQNRFSIASAFSILHSFQFTGLLCIASAAFGGDWPGHLGSNRNGVASSNELIAKQLDSIPKIAWELSAGDGYAGASLANNQACLFDHDGAEDRLRLVALESGEVIWEKRLPTNYRGGIDSDLGPRCVPTIVEDKVVLYSAAGDLSVVDLKDGSVRWTRPLRRDFRADDGYFGAGSTPLVFGDLIVVNVGGKDAGVVALSLASGEIIWKTGEFEASYASPILISIAGQPRILVPTRLKTILLNPADGTFMSEIRFGARGPTVNAATPIPIGKDRLFLTASYGIGTLVIDTSSGTLVEIERNATVSSQYATPVYSNGLVFASDGREDGGESAYVCIDSNSQKVLWSQPNMPIAHSILVGSQVLVVGIDGRIWSLSDKATMWSPLWTLALPAGNYRALPALSNGILVTRTVGTPSKWKAIRLD